MLTLLISADLYAVARGSSVIPKSVTPSRIEENMKIIKLDSSDVKALDHISQTKPPNRFVYPQFGVSSGELDMAILVLTSAGQPRLPGQAIGLGEDLLLCRS